MKIKPSNAEKNPSSFQSYPKEQDNLKTYAEEADRYEALVSREDYQGNILKTIQSIIDPRGLVVADLGAGTGRLAVLLAPLAKFVYAFDTSAAMLAIAATRLDEMGLKNWHTEAADHRNLPLQGHEVDLVVSGWSFCYLATLNPQTWQAELEKGLAEIKRILKPGGTIIIIETNGTGFEEPNPPSHLAPYFAWLQENGFSYTWVRTDYCFEPGSNGTEVVRSFFGDEMAARLNDTRTSILPECTGFWYKH